MRRTWKTLAVMVVVIALATTGCGDDDDNASSDTSGTSTDGTAAEATSDDDAYCEATEAVENAGEPDIDFETASEEEIAAAVMAFTSETLLPLVDEAVAAAPEELSDEAAILQSGIAEMAETGDFAALESPEFAEAEQTVHAYDIETCGWAVVDVTTKDYSFEGLPAEMAAGPTSFELTNEGADVHEIALLRKNDGVTESVEELLELPEEEADTKVSMIGVAGPVPNGGEAYVFADLEPGEYIAICFLPVGMTSMDAGPPPDGPPHFTEGMVAEFSVN